MRLRDTTTPHQTLEALERDLHERGFSRGAPPGIGTESLQIDRHTLRRMKCGHCGKQGLEHRPYKRGSAYSLLGVCKACGHAEQA